MVQIWILSTLELCVCSWETLFLIWIFGFRHICIFDGNILWIDNFFLTLIYGFKSDFGGY